MHEDEFETVSFYGGGGILFLSSPYSLIVSSDSDVGASMTNLLKASLNFWDPFSKL
jgi:hypothetical protein